MSVAETDAADLAHREYVANRLVRQSEAEREARENLRRAEHAKDRLMSRLAQLDVAMITPLSQVMDRITYTVGDKCLTPEGRMELSLDLLEMDPGGMVTREIIAWCRGLFPFRSVLTTYRSFVRNCEREMENRHGHGKAQSLMRGLLDGGPRS